ncbi:CopZ family metallochaperone [Candidatus Macondimonas diazotrophica]|jgi:copper chaperone|uniref:Copper chaperone n=1 Tax=Candidatus Macondimonas diazotrophica TaxID=2305248 RepID=A0A4Z0FB52_9GAMM|nr:cation transporter [Candidatus Macondimonas diazotrophica]MDY6955993.1 cation transporter [Pseudomonadota bacterium]NCU00384.1 heavy-metal-associated domain-containing protein [Candidatus Macondimonas diazotrophica]TFZ82708.1 copper chaperone [Candidatus Macondimonas diazotrophica]HBG50824.1 heavy metal-binding protein [Gammaproteobacteria bacterium]
MVVLKIDGMTCGHCVKAVSSALEQIPGVRAVRVDLERGQAEIDGSAELAQLIEAVREEGYDVQPVS